MRKRNKCDKLAVQSKSTITTPSHTQKTNTNTLPNYFLAGFRFITFFHANSFLWLSLSLFRFISASVVCVGCIFTLFGFNELQIVSFGVNHLPYAQLFATLPSFHHTINCNAISFCIYVFDDDDFVLPISTLFIYRYICVLSAQLCVCGCKYTYIYIIYVCIWISYLNAWWISLCTILSIDIFCPLFRFVSYPMLYMPLNVMCSFIITHQTHFV